jgi:predicted transcriptional regulator
MSTVVKKNKIVLSDYNYLRDIENRLLFSELSTFEVEVLQEILHSSVTFSVKSLVDTLGEKESKILPILEKFAHVKLLKVNKGTVTIDKEMRKYYEFQVEKFDESFKPDIEFILASLSKVPIHVLPIWYSIPRTTDNIYASLIEKHFLTPKIYERYLNEVEFDDPIAEKIFKDVFSSPNYFANARDLCKKYHLTREQFEEYMLFLEYNFICFISYVQVDGMWHEVVSPFYEWMEYLDFERDSVVTPIRDKAKIMQLRKEEFSFLQDMNIILEEAPIPLQSKAIAPKILNLLFGDLWKKDKSLASHYETYFKGILDKILELELGNVQDNMLHLTEEGHYWMKKSPEDRSVMLYRHPRNHLLNSVKNPELYSERNIREIEKSLRRVGKAGWISFEDFMRGFTVPIDNQDPVMLKKRGSRWKYVIPQYSEEDRNLIFEVIFERMFEVGLVNIGMYNGKPCFSISTFGRASFDPDR